MKIKKKATRARNSRNQWPSVASRLGALAPVDLPVYWEAFLLFPRHPRLCIGRLQSLDIVTVTRYKLRHFSIVVPWRLRSFGWWTRIASTHYAVSVRVTLASPGILRGF